MLRISNNVIAVQSMIRAQNSLVALAALFALTWASSAAAGSPRLLRIRRRRSRRP